MNSKQGYFIIDSTNTEIEQQLSHSKDRDYYVARGQKSWIILHPYTKILKKIRDAENLLNISRPRL